MTYERNSYHGIHCVAKGQQRRKNNRKKLVIGIVILLALIATFVFVVIKPFGQEVLYGQQIEIEVPEGAGAKQIGALLEENKVISSQRDFTNAVSSQNADNDLRPGVYTFTGGQSIDDIISALKQGGKTGETLTIPEGLTAKKIAEKVAEVSDISADEFYAQTQKASDFETDFSFVKGAYNNSLEGYLFPKTYTVTKDMDAKDIIYLMLEQYEQEFSKVDMSYAKSKNLNEHDVVVLASIIEKESYTQGDMADISCVFYNRLHEGMALGSDVTTYYAVGKEMTEDLTNADLASDSPYNTRNPNSRGLPPGPICNPSLNALKAAANPSQQPYLYFFYSSKESCVKFFNDDASFNSAWEQENS